MIFSTNESQYNSLAESSSSEAQHQFKQLIANEGAQLQSSRDREQTEHQSEVRQGLDNTLRCTRPKQQLRPTMSLYPFAASKKTVYSKDPLPPLSLAQDSQLQGCFQVTLPRRDLRR